MTIDKIAEMGEQDLLVLVALVPAVSMILSQRLLRRCFLILPCAFPGLALCQNGS